MIFILLEVSAISAKDTTQINDDIRVKEVRVIGSDGEQIGILKTDEAREIAYEKGLDLTVENVRKQIRFHPRCGTSFLLIVVILSIFAGSFMTWDSVPLRMLTKLLTIPVVVSLSYELIKFAGRHDNWLTKIISAPGLWLQRFTTQEPDDDMIEVAIAAVTPVLPENREEDRW